MWTRSYRMWEMKRLLPILVAAVMLVLAVGCSNNNAEVEQLRKELDEILVASNENGGVSPPVPFVVDPLECTLVTDFHFDQIVLTNIALGKVSWTDISTERVGIDLSKDQEDEDLNQRSELNWSDHNVSEYLRLQQEDGFQIALVETFAHSRIDDMHRTLAKQINEAFFTGLDTRTSLPNVEIFVNPEEALEKWFAAYRDESFPLGTARINLYFVSGNCTDGN